MPLHQTFLREYFRASMSITDQDQPFFNQFSSFRINIQNPFFIACKFAKID